ncbi:hypothetical protein L6258_01350 [Candidatus Parcubacteria bacterium]|nr:hypothetical protein [Candidatus Parcubacteria bacterium]
MIHSILVCGGTAADRQNKVLEILKRKKLTPDADTQILERGEKTTIGIDQVRDLGKFLSRKPFAAPQKAGIIPEAGDLTTEAQNALLKTLEEPPAHSQIILTTRGAAALLPTVVSRCQVLELGPKIGLDFTRKEVHQKAEELLEILNWNKGQRLAWVESQKSELTQKGEVLKIFEIWLATLRDLLVIQTGNTKLLLNPTLKEKYQVVAGQLTLNEIQQPLEHLQKLRRALTTTNVSPRLTLEVFLLKLNTR